MRPQLVDMEGWTLLSSDRQVVPHELRAEAELLYADLRRGFEAFPELYWQAPPSYLGDRVSGPGGPWGRRREGVWAALEGGGRQWGRPCPGRDGPSVRVPGPSPRGAQDLAVNSGRVVGIRPGPIPLPHLQVSSYGGTLRYELHSETQRGDVFIPRESRPDVVLQVTDGVDVAGWAGGHSGQERVGPGAALTCPRTSQGNQMSITFLEPVYPAPGHVHQGQLQLVEVSAAGPGAQVP